jgi:flagellar biogenesis protein FliO
MTQSVAQPLTAPLWLRSAWCSVRRWSSRIALRREPRRLRLCDTLALGNRGFVAVIRYEDQNFLIGGTNNSLVLLAQLSAKGPSALTGAGRELARLSAEEPGR